ncbi:cobalamin synthesis protein P47K [Haliangium ochraceum DSM 14365]|uniref:Cobalamin synthesis protein P47K n=1 Tax=Haliangium ochraceum (strain DSM 14365 / JCM 11303 / SMP-2) TaxID=502025 RepID=D0LLH8_HALO1|nr:cobalamin synthesis protein P47K [Haliangium ochraceum DSM 14365]
MLGRVDRLGSVLALAFAAACVVLAFFDAPRVAAALLAIVAPVAVASAWAGWRVHRRGWPVALSALGLVVAGVGGWLGVGGVLGTILAAVGGLTLAAAHDIHYLLRRRAPVPIVVLTGFLGSGKTTLLNQVLARGGAAGTVVIVNEFGEVGLDHLLVEHVDERMMYLSNGCICCTVRGDLIKTLQEVFTRADRGEMPPVHRVLVETTGMAEPAPIVHALMPPPLVTPRYQLAAVVTTVDAVNGLHSLQRHPEVAMQVAMADRVFLTKTDLNADVEELRARLREVNPGAMIVDVVRNPTGIAELLGARMYELPERAQAVDAWLGDARHRARDQHAHGDGDHDHDHGGDEHHHDHEIRSHCVTREQPLRLRSFQRFMALLAAEQGDDLLRVKGILHLAERPGTPALVHGVQHVLHPVRWLPRWPEDDRTSRLVFITRGIPRERLDLLLSALERADVVAPAPALSAEAPRSPDA